MNNPSGEQGGRSWRLRVVVLLPWLVLGCAPSVPADYARHANQARDAYARGDYAGAARYWEQAAEVSDHPPDRNQALYRAAQSALRAGDDARALARLREVQRQAGPRSARAAFDLADYEIEHGDPERGFTQLVRAILKYPRSGVVRGAMRRVRIWLVKQHGPKPAARELERLSEQLRDTEAESTALYERAKALDSSDAKHEALAAYLQLRTRFPYPTGVHWDDATLRAAELSRQLGQTQAARTLLEDMLEHREQALLTGSYERHYDTARFRLAELEAETGRWQHARAHWVLVFETHPTSRLRDDALWQAALISRRHGDVEEACKLMARLKDDLPDSRYAACAHWVCPHWPEDDACHDYIVRELR